MPTSPPDGASQRDIIHIVDDNLRKGFAQMPRPVLKAKGLSVKAKLVYVLLLDYAWQDDSCFPGQPTMAANLDISVDSVQRALQELKAYQLVDWKQQGLNRPNVYYILRLSDCPQLGLGDAGNRKLRLPETATLRLPETADCGSNNTQKTIHSTSNTTTQPFSANPAATASKFRKSSRQKSAEKSGGETPPSAPPQQVNSQGMTQIREVLSAKGLARPHGIEAAAQYPPGPARQAGPAASAPASEQPAAPSLPSAVSPPRRRRRSNVSLEEQQAIQAYLGDFAPELGDQAPFQSTVTRVCNLYAASGVTLGGFLQRLYAARARTKERFTSIRSPRKRFAYFLALVEEECGLREPPTAAAAAVPKSAGTARAVPPTSEPARKSLAGRYSHLVRR